MAKSNLESKAKKSEFNPLTDLPKTTRIANNIIDFGGFIVVYGIGITYFTIQAIKVLPGKAQEFYNNIADVYQNISPFIENILRS